MINWKAWQESQRRLSDTVLEQTLQHIASRGAGLANDPACIKWMEDWRLLERYEHDA